MPRFWIGFDAIPSIPCGWSPGIFAPGSIDTPRFRKVLDKTPGAEQWVERLAKGIPLRRLGLAEDVAQDAAAAALATWPVTGVPEFIQLRQIGHFQNADPAYGKGVAERLGLADKLGRGTPVAAE
jgi:hypothetical protein